MSGTSKPAMSISGSGNHGIVATITLAAVAEKMKINEEKLARVIDFPCMIKTNK